MEQEHRMLDARILQEQGYTQRQIAEILNVTDRTVRNYLKTMPRERKKPVRASKVDPYKPLIDEVLERNPYYNSEILFERLLRLGYTGKKSILKDYVAVVRRKLANHAVMRFETEPGFQAQVDWKEFGSQIVDGRRTKLYAFLMVMGYSRRTFVYFTTSMETSVMLACHLMAFQYFGGVPREILYDNMKTAFLCDAQGVWRPTRRLSAVAAHYGFTPRRCRVRRPETKGKVERAVGYLDSNFWPRLEGQNLCLAELNAQVKDWLAAVDEKPLVDFGESRRERFKREQAALKPVRTTPCDVRQEIPVAVNRESMIRYQTNSYSVPPQYIGQLLTLKVDLLTLEAELYGPQGSLRRFTLSGAGSRQRIMFSEDRQALLKCWEEDRRRTARRRCPRKSRTEASVEVQVRSPLDYELFAAALIGGVCA
jgi:transposase